LSFLPPEIVSIAMNLKRTRLATALFFGMGGMLFFWATITLYLEMGLGWPSDRIAWSHRAIGWFVNFVLMRTFIRGMKRYYALRMRYG